MAETLRIGLIGAGAVAQVAHLPTLTRMKGVQVVAICDTDGAKAQAVAQRFRIPDHFDDIEELLKHEALDAILVSTPNHLHESHILAGLSAADQARLAPLVDALLAALTPDVRTADHICRLCDEDACGLDDCPVERRARALA